MTREEQIAALQQEIARIDAEIAQLEELRRQSAEPPERAKLDAQIASQEETQQALEDELEDLQFPPDAFPIPG
jgi:septal ring factor EnvC (AmiA/AmiB activator)